MITKLSSNSLIVFCLLTTGLYTNSATAKWYVNKDEGYYKPQEFYNDKFGDFPPKDIDSKIMNNAAETKSLQKETKPAEQTKSSDTSTYEQESNTTPNSSDQNYQQPPYGNYGQQNYNQNYYNPGAGYPPGNSQGSGFSGPWNNNGSSFSGPWNNNGSNFSGPWNNNGSSFSMPWGNNRSGFSPWGNSNNRRR
jgi:hypothetical protein